VPRATDDAASPSSHADDDHRLPQGDTEANRGAARDQVYVTARDPLEGHPKSVEGHGDEV
jgi:hypothetical protein